MSKLTAEQRRNLPLDSFGDPDRRLFPIVDESDVADAAALIGKAKNPAKVKARIIAIAKRKGFKLPQAWEEEGTMAKNSAGTRASGTSVAHFDLDTGGRYVDGDMAVYPHALLFRAGSYPDKDYEMSPEDLWLAVENFEPVSGNIEHSDFLRGRACQVRSLALDDQDNTILRGEVSVPLWLDEQLSSSERKLSCEWDRGTKLLSGVGLVVNPRIPEAALMSAYASFARPKRNTPTGQRHLQQIHDMTVERGATCNTGSMSGYSAFASTHEGKALQAIHDLASEHGAQCETMDEVRDNGGHGGDVRAAPMIYSTPSKEKKKMGIDFKALFSGLFGAIEERESASAPIPPVTPTLAPSRAQDLGAATSGTTVITSPDPRIAELEKQVAERDATIAREAEARIQREAALFAEEMVREGKATPAEQEKLAVTFAQAMRDDQRHDAVTFGEGEQKKTTSRVQQLRDIYEARPAGVLTQQMLPDGQDGQQAAAVFNKAVTERVGPDGKKIDGPLSAERRRALLEGSSLGRSIVQEAAKNGHSS